MNFLLSFVYYFKHYYTFQMQTETIFLAKGFFSALKFTSYKIFKFVIQKSGAPPLSYLIHTTNRKPINLLGISPLCYFCKGKKVEKAVSKWKKNMQEKPNFTDQAADWLAMGHIKIVWLPLSKRQLLAENNIFQA